MPAVVSAPTPGQTDRVTRCARPLLLLVGLVALVALGLTVAPREVSPTRALTAPARIVAADEHAAFVGGVDPRPSTRLGSLFGPLSLVALAIVGLGFWACSPTLGPAASSDRRRRWRALLVGAPPAQA